MKMAKETTYTTSERNESRKSSQESPEDAKEHMKEKVSRGVAKVAGALEGFTSKAKEEHLSEKAQEAIQKAGETTRSVTETGRKEMKQTRQAMSGKKSKEPSKEAVGARMTDVPPSPTGAHTAAAKARSSPSERPTRNPGQPNAGQRPGTTGGPPSTTPTGRKHQQTRRQP